jgi:hypothetical protein
MRIRPGEIEVDFMMGKNHKGAMLVMTGSGYDFFSIIFYKLHI